MFTEGCVCVAREDGGLETKQTQKWRIIPPFYYYIILTKK